MLLSVSRRTDIPACYPDWLFNRLKEGYACVRNPMNPRMISRVKLSPEVVDGIVFWTKNPAPMLDRLQLLEDYVYYFQFTLNAYGKDLEPGVPNKNEQVIPGFQRLSREIGPERVIWRYDPVILTPLYIVEYHLHYFEMLAKRLAGYTHKCVISFVDHYRHLGAAVRELQFRPAEAEDMFRLAEGFSAVARRNRLTIETCAESVDLSSFGIGHGCCIDGALFERLLGQPLALRADPNQREACGCAISVDIGMYDSCANGCRYCYANHAPKTVCRNILAHDPASPLLYGAVGPEDSIKDREMKPCRQQQIQLF